MSQASTVINNGNGLAIRTAINAALAAIVSNFSGTSEPSSPTAYQWFADTTSGLLKLRNAANTAWVTVGTLSATNLGLVNTTGATFTGALLAAVGLVSAPGVAFDGDSDTGFYWVSANTWGLVSGGTEYLRISPTGITFLGTGAIQLPSGTTAQRPGSPSNGAIRYNSDLTAIDVYINGWLAIPTVSSYPFSTGDIASPVEVVPLLPFDFSSLAPCTPLYPQFPWSSPTKLTNPTTLPTGNGSSVATTPSGEYLAVGNSTTTPYVTIYRRKGAEYVKIADPATLPTGGVTGVAFSQNGEFLLCSHATTPFMTCYQRTVGTDTWTKLTNPATLPAAQGNGAAISPNGEFFVIAHNTSPFFSCYQRSGTTLTKISNPATLPTGIGQDAAWSPDGRFLAIVHTSSPYLSIYERTAGTTLTKLSNPASLPPNDCFGAAWSNDGKYLSVVHATSPYCTVYSRSGTTFTKMVAGNTSEFANSAEFPTGQGNGVAFSLDGSYMAIAHSTTPYVTIYSLVSGKWIRQANPATLPAGNGIGVCWNFEREMLYVAHNNSPNVTMYQTASDMPASAAMIIKKILRAGV